MYDIVVETSKGELGGTTANGVHVYRGVPYGAPTGGANRFRAPEPRAPWDGIRDATRFGETAPQRTHAEMAGTNPGHAEGESRMSAFMQFLHGLAGDEPAQGED